MICPQFRPIAGGYERAAERLSAGLAARGLAVTVITERRDRAWSKRELLAEFGVHRLWCVYRRGVHTATTLASFSFWLLRHGRSYGVWHVHQYGVHASLTLLLARLLRRRVVLKLTSSGEQGIDKVLATARLGRLQRWAHRRVDACVALTAEMRKEAVSFGVPATRVVEIGNSVDTDSFSPRPMAERPGLRARLGLPPRPVAVSVGRLSTEKNPLGLLEAWRIAQEGIANAWTLVMVGDGPLRPQVEQRVRELEISDSVVIAGNSSDVRDWLRAAEVFVLASHNEGMSNTVLEALACGVPCVVTAVSGMQELVGASGAGLVVPARDAQALAEAIVKIQAEPDMREVMGRRGRELVMTRYSVSVITARYIELYRGLVSQGTTP